MTTLSAPPPTTAAPPPAPEQHGTTAAPVATSESAATRTLVGLLASALAIIPLKALFSDSGWLIDAWLAMAVVILPAAALRLRRPAGALDIWPGIVLLIPYLTARYVSQHAWLGFVPTTGTWHDLGRLMDALHQTTRTEVAPVHTTIAIRVVLCALVGLLAALIDLVAVVGHRGALAGVPMLVVYTIAGAVPRTPVPWVWFTFAAIGFLLLLGLDAGSEVQHWGRRIRGRTRRTTRAGVSTTGKRIGIVAILAAVVLPLLVPSQSRNLLSDAFHDHGSGLGSFGAGIDGGSIDPFAAIKGQLTQAKPIPLMTVHVDGAGRSMPFYLRINVLSQYQSDGWHAGDDGPTVPVEATSGFGTEPPIAPTERQVTMQARIQISGLDSNVPVFAVPTTVGGVTAGTSWSPQDQVLLGPQVYRGQVITETFAQPDPSIAQLRNAPNAPQDVVPSLAAVPSGVPDYVRNLVGRLVRHASGPYERAAAIQRYFTDPVNGFVYDLHSSVGDSGSALVDFLKGKHGYCQQYAAAMAVMLRVAGVPSRVVLGYMHPAPDANGNFTVSSDDAHSWVEAYFHGVGWIPFDPTPASGLADFPQTDLPWAQHRAAGEPAGHSGINNPHATGSGHPSASSGASTAPTGAAHHQPGASAGSTPSVTGGMLLTIVLVLLALVVLLLPALIRARRRRRRLLAARRHGDTEALWAELSDTAVDLGYVWSPARSPRQVVDWLGRDVRRSGESLHALAAAVEQHRYAPDVVRSTANGGNERLLGDQLRQVTNELRHRRNGRRRIGAVLWPASLTAALHWRRWWGRAARRQPARRH